MRLGSREISFTGRPYIIAEIGVNHEGDFELAKKLIELAKQGGADAAKFQSYKAGKIASKFSPSYWDTSKEPTKSQYELFKKYDNFGEQEYILLAEHCKKVGIDFLSTPFDAQAVEFLEPLMPFYKIASADLTNTPMLRQISLKGKPIVLSTGASTLEEIKWAVDTLSKNGAKEICLLHCVLNYPTPNQNANLNMIEGLKKSFPNIIVGYSDHTLPDENMLIVTSAWAKGAQVLEKHFTHDKKLPGNDHYHAMDVEDLKKLVSNIEFLEPTYGDPEKHFLSSEEPARKNARRSIVALRNLNKGEVIKEENITYKRPAHGISPIHWDEVIGKTLSQNVAEDTPLQWEHFK